MSITDDVIRDGLSTYADSIHTTPPPLGVISRASLAPAAETRRRVRRSILVGAVAGGLLIGVGVAAASGVFHSGTKNFLESTCGLNTENARLVARDTDALGNIAEFWVVSQPEGEARVIIGKGPTGDDRGGSAGCNPGGPAYPAGQPWSEASATNLDGQPTTISLYGWIPQPATTAIVTFIDGSVATVTARPDGYFLDLLNVPASTNVGLAHIEARTDDSTLVAEHKLLG